MCHQTFGVSGLRLFLEVLCHSEGRQAAILCRQWSTYTSTAWVMCSTFNSRLSLVWESPSPRHSSISCRFRLDTIHLMQEDCAHTVLSFTNLEKRKIFYNTKSNRLYRAIGRSFTLQQTSTDKFTGQFKQTNFSITWKLKHLESIAFSKLWPSPEI